MCPVICSALGNTQTLSHLTIATTHTITSVYELVTGNQCIHLNEHIKCVEEDGYWCVNNGYLLCKPEPDGWLIWLRRVDCLIEHEYKNITLLTCGGTKHLMMGTKP